MSMFKKDKDAKKEPEAEAEDEPKTETKKAPRLPLVIALGYPYKLGKMTVHEIRCERRPTVRTMKRLASCGEDDDAEMIEVMFEEMFDLAPAESDLVDMEDGLRALEAVGTVFPKLKAETDKKDKKDS